MTAHPWEAPLRQAQLFYQKGFGGEARRVLLDYIDGHPHDWDFVRHLAQTMDWRVVVEEPVDWLNDARVGPNLPRLYGNLFLALAACGIPFSAEPTRPFRDDHPRVVPPRQTRIAYHSFGDVAHCWRVKEAYLPDWYYFDRRGYSGWAEISDSQALFEEAMAIDAAEAVAFRDDLRRRLTEQNVSKYKQAAAGGFRHDAPFVFLAMQMPGDTVSRLARVDTVSLVRLAADQAARHGRDLVVKRHPLCKDDAVTALLAELADHPRVTLTDAALADILPQASAVLVVNSGVGFEALVHGKPVYASGAADYQWLTHAVAGADDLAPAFTAPRPAADDLTQARFITWFLTRYCVSASDFPGLRRKLIGAVLEAY